MVAQFKEIYHQLLSELELLDEEYIPDLAAPDQRVLKITVVLDPLKKELTDFQFESDEQEICFYKEELPKMFSLFIYYTEKSGIGMSELIGTRKSRAEYRNRLMKRIDDFSTENAALYDYYSFRKTGFDSYYFLRSSPLNREAVVLFGDVVDPRICPGASIKIAMMSAYRKLDAELNEGLSDHPLKGRPSLASDLRWTGTKRDLTELVYALTKYVNNGLAPIKEIVNGFQNLFNIDLGNYPRAHQELLARKKGESFFLQQLVNDQQQKMEEIENERLRSRGFK